MIVDFGSKTLHGLEASKIIEIKFNTELYLHNESQIKIFFYVLVYIEMV